MSRFGEYLDTLTIEGALYEPLSEGDVRCTACAHRCLIHPGKRGICQVRYNRDGKLFVPWGYVAALQADPIEKKPFNHLLPGSDALDLNVPSGVVEGQVLRLKGKGRPGVNGGPAGDALVEIRVRPHPVFKRTGDDLSCDCPLTIDEAVIGAKIEVPTLTGRVQLTIPPGTSSGRVFRLKGKGIANATAGSTGDQLVTVRIVLPETADESLVEFLRTWREALERLQSPQTAGNGQVQNHQIEGVRGVQRLLIEFGRRTAIRRNTDLVPQKGEGF